MRIQRIERRCPGGVVAGGAGMQARQGPHWPRLQWIETRGPLESRQSVGQLSLALQAVAQEGVGVGIAGIELHGFGQGGGRLGQVAPLERLNPLAPPLLRRAIGRQAPMPR